MNSQAGNNLETQIDRCLAILRSQPHNFEALNQLAGTYHLLGRLDEAIASYRKILLLSSDVAVVHFNLATVYFSQSRFNQAITSFQNAIAIKPDLAEAYCGLGTTFYKLNQLDEAIAAYEQAISLNPNYAEAHCRIAAPIAMQGRYPEAIQRFQSAITLDPNHLESYCYLGVIWIELCNHLEALKCFQSALSINPHHVESHFYLSHVLLWQGNLLEGFKEYEWRTGLKGFEKHSTEKPIWDGSNLDGKIVLVISEQGLGDILQFVRYIPLIAQRGGRVILQCPTPLVHLLSQVTGVIEVIPSGSPLPNYYDIYTYLLSLPYILGTTLETIPAQIPYLKPIYDTLNVLTAPANTKLKVGIVWSSGYRQEISLLRMYQKKSCSLSFFLELEQQYPDICFYSLQLGKDVLELQPHLSDRFQDLSNMISDFGDTGDLIDQLDLVISVDTAVAHLSGAMAKPTWLLLPFSADWRWLLNRFNSPWYPTMLLFRQPELGDWQSVFTQVRLGLANVLATKDYQQAQVYYQQGNLTAAIASCENVVKHQPQFAPAYASLANMQNQIGEIEAAIVNYEVAIKLQPNLTEAYAGLINIFQSQNRLAESNYWREKLTKIEFQIANQYLQNYLQSGDLSLLNQAIFKYQIVIKFNPYLSDAYINLSVALRHNQQLDEAINYLNQVIQFQPQSIEAYYNLGVILAQQSNLNEAIAYYEKILSIQYHEPASYNLAIIFQQQERWQEAINLYEQIVKLNPNQDKAYCNLGICLKQEKQVEPAIAAYKKALEINPKYAEVYCNLSLAYILNGKISDAINCCEQALEINPNFAEAYCNLGFALMQIEQIHEAIANFEKAIKIEPNYALARYNLSHAWLKLGEYTKGWQEYECRWDVKEFETLKFFQPMWDGSNLNSKTILLYAEQGFGDVLQFVRYAELVAARGGKVIVQCEAPLVSLLQSTPYISEAIAMECELPSFDVYAPLMSLPYLFGTTLETIPNQMPYLFSPQAIAPNLQIATTSSKLKVGIVWASGFRGKLAPYWMYQQKSCPLSYFLDLLSIPNIDLYSLQVGQDRHDLAKSDLAGKIPDLGAGFKDFADTSAAIAQLDLVIAVDTSVAHLVGAMNKPIWLLLHFNADWRWLMNRSDSPWYPSMRLFKQKQMGDWESIFAEVIPSLQKLV